MSSIGVGRCDFSGYRVACARILRLITALSSNSVVNRLLSTKEIEVGVVTHLPLRFLAGNNRHPLPLLIFNWITDCHSPRLNPEGLKDKPTASFRKLSHPVQYCDTKGYNLIHLVQKFVTVWYQPGCENIWNEAVLYITMI